ncbi:MAG: class I SAM-dependent methyltransferase [Gammaproteobacteria bacterium]|nr:class I SAM-dependent methyltransferase [Gammaproteobacteria bacterium]
MSKKEHWEQIYTERKPSQVSWYQSGPYLSLSLIELSHLKPTDSIIDVGGGASTLIDSLLLGGYTNISVLDISSQSLEHAKKRLGDQARQVKWLVSDITEFTPEESYLLWHDRAVFHFLTDAEDRKKYINTMRQSVPAGGHIIIAAFSIGGPEKCSGLEIVQYDADKLKNEFGNKFKLLKTINETHITPNNAEQNFTYYHFLRL